jgi:hypothetical protein
MVMKKAKSFKYWTSEEIEKTFHIQRVYKLDSMTNWLGIDRELSPDLYTALEKIKNDLSIKVEYLNEEELKSHYLIKMFDLIDFEDFGRYRTFLGRQLTAQRDGLLLNGEVDFMIATGKSTPDKPFFFLHEYKQELKRDNDPLGQLLIAMLAAQTRNETEDIIHGCYIVGRFFFGVILDGTTYSVSKAFDLSDDDIFRVGVMLLKTKEHIKSQIDLLIPA